MTTLLKPPSEITLLIVDDTADNLRLIARILETQGYIVRKALNGKMALQGVLRQPPDLILLDINMPEMSGYEVCRALKGNPKTAHIPIIFISALDQIQDKVLAFETGGSDYITKPFQEQEILMRVKNQLLIQQQQQAIDLQRQQLAAKNEQLKQEIQERQKAEAEVQRLAITDELTSLLNRRGFHLLATQQLKLAQRATSHGYLLFADLDGLKTINDTLGHAAGDQMIQDTAQILRDTFRQTDILARLGGDEFVVLIPACDRESAELQSRLQTHIDAFNQTQTRPYSIAMSFAFVECLKHQQASLETLIQYADDLMYQQKRRKKAAVQHD
ncbi:GGDEF domain-containing response regulator [Leptolyngbya iicbica]|uniref:Diguanylate cyclase n=2 Tax=Cyanophyceae TaxID=3028117 RepID=A0A4Q7EF71_9CYAN|nr:diguanylate cyclase [Leptolyngbya sp. LK]RZM81915.1 diguanylate cyclase [Leptolyngbya sp. LK]